jgi:hypothetical protein
LHGNRNGSVKFRRRSFLTLIKIPYDLAISACESVSHLRCISREQLENFGVDIVAYVKSTTTESGQAFAIHAADGRLLAIADTEALAAAIIIQNEMLPRLVH